MKFAADLHIHSHYSRATSAMMNIESLDSWARVKGIQVIGTGDFTHPKWFSELRQNLESAEPGLFKSKTIAPTARDFCFPLKSAVFIPKTAVRVKFIL